MARDGVLAEALGQLLRHALGEGARVHEHERRLVRLHELGQPVEDVGPLLLGRHRLEIARRHLDVQLEIALVAAIDDVDGPAGASEEARDLLDGALRGGEPNANRAPLHEVVQARQAQGEVAAAAVPGERVDLVDDDRAHAAQVRATALGREEEVERLRGGDEDVGWAAHHALPPRRGRVARANGNGNRRQLVAEFGRDFADLGQRLLEVALDVVAERLQRRDVDDAGGGFERARLGLANELIDADEEGGEGLAGARGRGHEGGFAALDTGPAESLRVRRAFEAALEPGANGGVERGQALRGGGRRPHRIAVEHLCGRW